MRRFLHIVPLVAVILVACSRKGEVIPLTTFSSIYADMLIADAWLRDHDDARRQADTTMFYDPIFERYGYDFEDYDASVNYYLRDPDRMYKVLRKACDILKKRQSEHRSRKQLIETMRELSSHVVDYRQLDFSDDSLLWTVYDSLLARSVDSLLIGSCTGDTVSKDAPEVVPEIPDVREDLNRLDTVRHIELKEFKR